MRERTTLKMGAKYSRMGALVGGMALLVLIASCVLNNTSPGTRSSGPVIISTDHSVYATSERIQVTVTNRLPVDIYADDLQASCSILDLEMQVQGQWQWQGTYRQGGCSARRLNFLVRIASGQSYTATIQAGYQGFGEPIYYHATFLPGLYRLVLRYSTVASESTANMMTISSATLTQSLWFAPVGIWAFLLGSGLTVLLLGVHLVVAAQQRSWGWCLLLLVGPLFCFGCYAFCYAVGFGPGMAARWIFIPGIGLPNLLFAFSIMQPRREAAPTSLAALFPPN